MRRFVAVVNFVALAGCASAVDAQGPSSSSGSERVGPPKYTFEPTGQRFKKMTEASKVGHYLVDNDFCNSIIREWVATRKPEETIDKLASSSEPWRALAFSIELTEILVNTHKRCMEDRGYTAHRAK